MFALTRLIKLNQLVLTREVKTLQSPTKHTGLFLWLGKYVSSYLILQPACERTCAHLHTQVLTCELLSPVPMDNKKQSQAASLQGQFCWELPVPQIAKWNVWCLNCWWAAKPSSVFQWKLCNFPIRIRWVMSENKKLLSNLPLKKTLWYPPEANIWLPDSQRKHNNNKIKKQIRLSI